MKKILLTSFEDAHKKLKPGNILFLESNFHPRIKKIIVLHFIFPKIKEYKSFGRCFEFKCLTLFKQSDYKYSNFIDGIYEISLKNGYIKYSVLA